MSDYFLYVKTTNKCQLNCTHCYTNSDSTKTDEIDFDRVETFINNFCSEHPNDRIIASMHGGEPMLADNKKIYNLIKNTKHNNIFWSATTNLVYTLTDEKLKIFREFQQPDGSTLILTSYDLLLRFKDNQEQIWMNNVKTLIEMGFDVKPIVCFSCYMNAKNVRFIFDMFIDMGIKVMNFERITESGRAIQNPLRYNNKDLDDVLFEVYKMWDTEYRDKLSVTLFEDIELAFNKHILVGCRARKCMENVITINPDGSVAGCPNCSDKTYMFIDGLNNGKYSHAELCAEEKNKNKLCYSCKYFEYCNGDCFQLKWDDNICPAPRKIYEYILRNINGDKTKI